MACVVNGDCDDNDPCTDDACVSNSCVFTPLTADADGDGTPDCIDACPTDPEKIAPGQCGCGSTDTDTDSDGLADCNDPCPTWANLLPYDACNDGNAYTINDVLNTSCVCEGTPVACVVNGDCNDNDPCTDDACIGNACIYTPLTADADGDGTPDCADNCPNAPGQQGSPCDDGFPLTINDILNASCVCEGTPVACVVNGDCDDNDPCTDDACVSNSCVFTPLTADADGDGTPDCIDACPTDPEKIAPGQCGCGSTDTDTDSDGLADCNDPCPTWANLLPYDACNDGNAYTINDVLNTSCVCEGTPVACVVNGDCNDNDPCTDDACIGNACIYTPLTADADGDGTPDCADNCPNMSGQIGSLCDDSDPTTGNDVLTNDCVCTGQLLDCVGVPGGGAIPGVSCDDDDDLTENDVYQTDCICSGTPTDTCAAPTIVSAMAAGPICEGEVLHLIVVATGSPDLNYAWTGVGAFAPAADAADVLVTGAIGSYSVVVMNGCGSASATVVPEIDPLPAAGEDNSIIVEVGTLVNLNLLLSVDSANGTFGSQALVVAAADTTYPFVVGIGGNCGTDTSLIHVLVEPDGFAGEDASVQLCPGTSPVNLLDYLNDEDQDGEWFNSEDQLVTMPVNFVGNDTFHYIVGGDTAIVTVVVASLPEAGSSTSFSLCEEDPAIDLLALLGGQAGGTWSGPATVSNDLFDPSSMVGGAYQYTVADTCGSDSAVVTISVQAMANASWNAPSALCTNSGLLDLNTLVTGDPGGMWSGNGLIGPLFDPSFSTGTTTITYSVGDGACASAMIHDVTVNPGPLADAGPDGEVCALSCTLEAVVDVVPGQWSAPLAPGTAVFADANDPHTLVEVSAPGFYTFLWTVGDAQCTAVDTAMMSFISPGTAVWVDAGPDQHLEVFTTTDLDGSLGPGALATWSIVSGSGYFADPHDTNSVVTNLAVGENVLVLQATLGDGCSSASDTLVITVDDIFIPQGYSPNGDGVNDQWRITGISAFPNSDLKVFNRWGQEVVGRRGYLNDWEGRGDNGQTLPDDTYFYVLNLTPERSYNGFVIIKR